MQKLQDELETVALYKTKKSKNCKSSKIEKSTNCN